MNQMIHFKKGAAPDDVPSMKVIYVTLQGQYYDFVCFEHHKFEGQKRYFAYERALEWYGKFSHEVYRGYPPPKTVKECLELTYCQPSRIMVKRNGKFYNVVDYDFTKKEDEGELDGERFEIPF
jgi:hypothetical protein